MLGTHHMSTAQYDISLLMGYKEIQSTFFNPATIVDKKLSISVLDFNSYLNTNGPTINQIANFNKIENAYTLKKDGVDNIKNSDNLVYGGLQLKLADVLLKLKNWQIGMGHTFRLDGSILYHKEMLQLIVGGNDQFLGQSINIGPKIDLLAYNEVYFSGARKIGKLSVGAKAKLLFGSNNVQTSKENMVFTTDEENFGITVEGEYTVRSSNMLRIFNNDSLTFKKINVNFDNLFVSNTGIGIDLGVTYQFTSDLSFGMSILDLGSINWTFFPRKYSLQEKVNFTGFDVFDDLVFSNQKLDLDATINKNIKIKSELEPYRTPLNTTILISGSYVKQKYDLHGMMQYNAFFGHARSSFSIAYNKKYRFFDIGGTYQFSSNTLSDFGILGQAKLGPLRIYAFAGQVIGLLDSKNTQAISGRCGMQLRI